MQTDYNNFLVNLENAISRDDIDTIVSLWYTANVTSSFKKDKQKLKRISDVITKAMPKIAAARKIPFHKGLTFRQLVQLYDESIIIEKLQNNEEIVAFLEENPRRAKLTLQALTNNSLPPFSDEEKGRLFYWLALGLDQPDPKLLPALRKLKFPKTLNFLDGLLEEAQKTDNVTPFNFLLAENNTQLNRIVLEALLDDEDDLLSEKTLQARMLLPDRNVFLQSMLTSNNVTGHKNFPSLYTVLLKVGNLDYQGKDILARSITRLKIWPSEFMRYVENIPYDYTFHHLLIFYLYERGNISKDALIYLVQKYGFDRDFYSDTPIQEESVANIEKVINSKV